MVITVSNIFSKIKKAELIQNPARYSFKGGIHMEEYKLTASEPIQKLPAPARVRVPLSQHIGAPCTPTVEVGDTVDKGQIIGVVAQGLGCPVHATVSGKVTAIEEVFTPAARKVRRIVIDNDGEDRLFPEISEGRGRGRGAGNAGGIDVTPEECIEAVRLAGISGMGGATFPTYAKISSALGKADKLIINCAECEPFITADHRMMLEYPHAVIDGTRLLMRVFGLDCAMIAIEDNKPDAAELLAHTLGDDSKIQIKLMKTKYPQGDERQLIYALTGQELAPGKLPADLGCVIFNVETCVNIYRAVTERMPLIERIVTVSGDCISAPKNVLVPIGTSISELITFCGGFKQKPAKLVMGGPMMGVAQWDINAPVTKGTNAVLALSEKFADNCGADSYACLHCGKCVKGCPMHLMPLYLAQYAAVQDYEMCGKFNIMNCVECGSCSYICPGKVPIVQFIRMTKAKIREEAAAAAAAKAASNTH